MVQVRCGCVAEDSLFADCAHKGGIAFAGWLGSRLKITGFRSAIGDVAPQIIASLCDYATIADTHIESYVEELHAAEDRLALLDWPGLDLRDASGEIVLTCYAGDWLYEDTATGDIWSISDAGLYCTAYDALFDRYSTAGTWTDALLSTLPTEVRTSLKEAAQGQGDAPPVGATKPAAIRLTACTAPGNLVFEEMLETLYDALAEATLRSSSLEFVPIGE